MTSISVTGSGQREYNLRAGSGQYTAVGLQPKAGDDILAAFGGVGKIEFAVAPTSLRIERRVKPEGEPGDTDGYLVVVIESEHATSINAIMRNSETNGLTPSISVRLQDELEPQFLDKLEVAESTSGAVLPGATGAFAEALGWADFSGCSPAQREMFSEWAERLGVQRDF